MSSLDSFRKIGLSLVIIATVIALSQCNRQPQQKNDSQSYLNHSDTVKYVGIEACRLCHSDIHQTFVKTGMGASFGIADTAKSIARLQTNSFIHDIHSGFFYHPFWQNDSLKLKEYRLQNGDTAYQRVQAINYVVGSGQHTNSHIYELNNYLFQAPFTWYSQEGKLDLPPGYENGSNVRFSRIIGLECMSCHNAMPVSFVKGSENKFGNISLGIDCERCHGPGEAHVKKVMAGNLTDTSTAVDYSIVNPKKLSVDLQFELCQRCHLQGNAVLAENRSFFDFKPGMKLNEVMDIYLPRYSHADDKFIMASHVDRFKQSKCFIAGKGKFNCISCHNPHVSVKETRTTQFNSSCGKCHSISKADLDCKADLIELKKTDFNCVQCHMPSSGSVDIPHVTVHDHFIRKPTKKVDTTGIGHFLGLQAVNNRKPGNRSKALAYMQQYERFEDKLYYLDSALVFLQKLNTQKKDHFRLWIQYYFLARDYQRMIEMVRQKGLEKTLVDLNEESYSNNDAWAAYRIGEAFSAQSNYRQALDFYQQAVELAPFVMDFRNKQASCYIRLRDIDKAKNILTYVLKELPIHKEALNNMGYCFLLEEETEEAKKYFDRALQIDSDYELAWLNLANAHILMEDYTMAEKALREVLRINPANGRASTVISQLKEQEL